MNKVSYDCPFCDEEHEVFIIKEQTKALLDNTPVEFEEISYYCPVEDEYFMPKEFLSKNLLAAMGSYKYLVKGGKLI